MPALKAVNWKVWNTNNCFHLNQTALEKILEETPDAKPFRIITGDFVTTEDGTGIVHTAPAFGADDYRVGKKNNIGILTMVDKRGRFLAWYKRWLVFIW